MADFAGAVEKAVFDRLSAQVTLAPVFQNVPDNTAPPVVIVSDIDFENEGDKDAPLLRFSVTITAIVAGRGRKPLNALQAQVLAALDRWRPTATASVSFGEARIETATGQEVQLESGPIYFGQQVAVLYAQDV